MTEPKLAYNLKEADEVLGMSAWSFRRAIDEGRIPHVRFARRIVVPRHALETALDELKLRIAEALLQDVRQLFPLTRQRARA